MPKVLVADDNRNIQKVVTLALKDQGIEVIGVGHGEAAVKQLAQAMPDLILADVFMPVRNGYEVCEYVKNNDQFSHIPVILLFGAYDPVDQNEVRRVRADGTLKKPFEPVSDLTTLVHMMLQKAAAAKPAEKKPPAGPDKEKTVELSAEDMQKLTAAKQPEAAAAEPEVEDFAVTAPKIEFSPGEQPLAFGELLGGAAPAAEEAAAPKAAEASFQASSLEEESGEAVAEAAPVAEEARAEQPAVAEREPSQWAAWDAETASAPAHAEPAPAAEEIAEPPMTGGIEVPAKEPSPDEPPLHVEFGAAEEIEIVREEPAAAAASVAEAAPLPELASSPTEFMEAAAAPPPMVETPAAPAPEMDIAAPPAEMEKPAPQIEAMGIPSMMEVAAPAEAPSYESAVAAEPAPVAEAAPPAVSAPAEAARAAAAPAPAFTGNTDALGRPHPDAALVDSVVEKVMARLDSGILDRLTREVIRPIVEAIVASEIGKK